MTLIKLKGTGKVRIQTQFQIFEMSGGVGGPLKFWPKNAFFVAATQNVFVENFAQIRDTI